MSSYLPCAHLPNTQYPLQYIAALLNRYVQSHSISLDATFDSIFFTLFSNFGRGIITWCPHPWQTITKSTPVRLISQFVLPQGWDFFICTTSPTWYFTNPIGSSFILCIMNIVYHLTIDFSTVILQLSRHWQIFL